MKKYPGLTLLIIMAAASELYSQTTANISRESLSFDKVLDSMHVEFRAPEGFVEIAPIENRQMNYEKSYKHSTQRFEVRYALRQHDFDFFQQIFEMTVLNISGGQLPEYNRFSSEAVRQEFGADAGATVMVEVGKEFGQDYKYCLLVYIYKKGVGDGYVFYLADDGETMYNLMMPIFHCLKFRA